MIGLTSGKRFRKTRKIEMFSPTVKSRTRPLIAFHTNTVNPQVTRFANYRASTIFFFVFFVFVIVASTVPSLPPQNVSSHNTSSTSLHISWQEVPHGFVHGILLGYRILFKIANKAVDFSVVSTSATTRYKELHGLGKFTVYEIGVLAFTGIGDGPNSTSVFISTDEDSKCQ